MRLDENDIAILKVLLKDGRESLREIAQKTSLTTPTVSYHFSRMIKSGLIKKFAPVLDSSMVAGGVSALVTLRVKAGETQSVSERLSALDEVCGVFLTTGRNNVTIRVSCTDARELQKLVNTKLPEIVAGEVVESNVVVNVVKDEQPTAIRNDIMVELTCDYCAGSISSNRPYNVRVGSGYHYFCCRTCRREYLSEHGPKIERVNAGERLEASKRPRTW